MNKNPDTPRARTAQILASALKLSARVGYTNITRETIAEDTGLTPSLVSYHCGTMPNLRRDVMREAVRLEDLRVIAQGIAARDPHALKCSDDLRTRALMSLNS